MRVPAGGEGQAASSEAWEGNGQPEGVIAGHMVRK